MELNYLHRFKFNKLCLTYDNLALCDGSGAQMQRIAFTYGLAMKYKYSHSRSGIKQIDSNPGDGLKNQEEKECLISNINDLLVSPLESCNHSYHTVISSRFTFLISTFNFYWLWLALNSLSNMTKINPQLKINHKLIRKKVPSRLYSQYSLKIKSDPSFLNWSIIDRSLMIQAHFLAAKNSASKMSERYIEPKKISKILELCKNICPEWKILVHSDVESRNQKWRIVGDQTEETLKYWRDGGILGENGFVNLNSVNLREVFPEDLVDEFATGIEPLEVWRLMANARILICGKSSLSFMGALLNTTSNPIIIVPKGFMKYPKNWIELDYEGEMQKFKISNKAKNAISNLNREINGYT